MWRKSIWKLNCHSNGWRNQPLYLLSFWSAAPLCVKQKMNNWTGSFLFSLDDPDPILFPPLLWVGNTVMVISEGFPSTLDRGDGSVPNLSHKLKCGLGRQRQVPRRYLFWYNLNRICFLFEAPPPTITGARQTELYYYPWMASSPQWWWLENCLICSLINVAEERRWKPITPFNEWDNSQRRGWAISLVPK